jgi:N-methylhydantoinase B
VARDVREGWISRDKAASTYQVVVDGAGRLDAAATANLRGERVAAAAGGE